MPIAALVLTAGCASHQAPPPRRVTVHSPTSTAAVAEPACDSHLGRMTSTPAKDGMVRVPSATFWMNDPNVA